MLINDPIADMLTRIRNGLVARHESVSIPASNTLKAIAKILLDEGYVKAVDYIDDGLQGQIKVTLKYAQGKESVIKGRLSNAFDWAGAKTVRVRTALTVEMGDDNQLDKAKFDSYRAAAGLTTN